MAISCDVSNKIIAWAITSEAMLQKIVLDMQMIDNYDKAIAKLWDNTDGIATLAYAKKWVESKVLYQTIGSYIQKTLQEEWLSKIQKINELQKTLTELMPENAEYFKKLDQLPTLKSYARGRVDENKIAWIIAFDVANLHKLQWVKKWWVEYIHYWRMNTWGAYGIYRDIMLDIVDNKTISETDVLTKIKKYISEHDEHVKERTLDKPEDIVDIIKNATTMKQLEETFILYMNYIDETTLPLFLSKVDDFKYVGDMQTKSFWQSLWNSYFNSENFVIGYRLDEMNRNALAYWKFQWIPFKKNSDEYFKFIDKAADVITGKTNSFTRKWVEFNQQNKDTLVSIVWLNNLEVAYARRWETSIQYDYIKQLQTTDKNIEIVADNKTIDDVTNIVIEYKHNDILTVKARWFDNFKDFEKSNRLTKWSKVNKEEHLKSIKKARKQKDTIATPKKQTKEEIQEFWPNTEIVKYEHSLVKVISNDNNTPITEEHLFYQPSILHSDHIKEWYNDTWALNSFKIWKPIEVISDENTLISRINASGKKDVYIMTRDVYTARKLKELWHKKWIKVHLTYPQLWWASIRIWDDKNAYVWFVNASSYRDVVDSFNSVNGKIFPSNILVEPTDALKNIKIWDKNITQDVIDSFGMFSPTNQVTFTQTANILRNTSRFNGRYTNAIVNYSDEYAKVQAMDLSDIIYDIEDLSNTKVTLQIDPTNTQKIKDDYYNYAYAENLPNKVYALNKLLENFQIDGWDLLYNYAKKDYIYKKLLLGENININTEWFDSFVNLLTRDDVSDEILKNNVFIKNTIIKNQRGGNPIVSNPRELYTYTKNTLLKEADAKIYNKNNITSEFVASSISVPREWEGFAIVENNVIMPPIHSRIRDIIWTAWKYENWKLTIDASILKKAQAWEPLDTLWKSDELINIIDYSKEGVDELFALYTKKVKEIIEKWWDDQWNDLQKLYDNFEYKLIQLEDGMQSSLWKTLDYWYTLDGYHHAIWRLSKDLDYVKYIDTLEEQKTQIIDTLEYARVNINNGIANGWVLNNGNILKWSIVEDWANYAYYLWRESWDDAPYEVLREMNSTDIKNYIYKQKNKIQSDIEAEWLIYHMYKAISPTLRNYWFLDEYKLVDTLYGYKLPKALVDVNPSLYSNGKALSMDLNDELLVNIYHGIIDMYNDWYGALKITGDIDKNLSNIQQIVKQEVDNLVDKYPKSQFTDVNLEWIRNSYSDVFVPYSSFLVMPQTTIAEFARLKEMDWWNIGDFLGIYLSKQPPESIQWKMLYDEKTLKKITDDVNNLEILANDWREQTYKDVFTGGITDWMMRQGRSILEKKWKNENTLLNLQLATKVSGKQMSNFLYNIVAKNMLFDVKFWKETNQAFRIDIDLLRKSQDTLASIANKNNTELDAWVIKNSQTSDLVAYYVARYINTYKTLLKWTLDDDVLWRLHNVFYMIWRNASWNIDEAITKETITQQVHRLSTIWESNSFLGIFNMPTAPKTELSNISFNMFSDGRVFVNDIYKEIDQFEWFNRMFKTNLTKYEYESLFQNMFWWKLVTRNNRVQKWYSWINKYALSIVWPIIKVPTTIGLNILSAFTTGFLPWMVRGKALVKWISKSDSKILADIMWRYNLLSEFGDLSDVWMTQLFKEAEKLWGWNIGKWLIRSFQSWSAANTMSLISTNTNNVMDVALIGNYKMFALYSAMQTLDWKRLFSVKSFDDYIKTLSDADVQKLMYIVEWHANRWLYSVIAASDSFMDQRIPSIWLEVFWINASKNITRYGSSLIRWLSHSLSFLNGWGNWIVRWFASGVFGNLDIAKYFIKNWLNKESIESVVRAIEKRPEYLQWVSTLYADISLLARWYRYQKTWEDDGETNIEDFMDALLTYTTIWQWYSSSLVWQLLSRWISTQKQIREQEKVTPTDQFKKWKIFARTIASTVSWRFMAQLKYLKPRKYMNAQARADINKWMDVWDAYSKALWTLLLNAGSWMLKFMMSDNYDPSQLSFTFQDRWDTPAIMWSRISRDQEAAYAQSYIQYGDLGTFANFLPNMWKASMFNTLLKKPVKQMLNWQPLSEDDIVYLTNNEPFIYNTLYLWKTPEVSYDDVSSIKNYIFDDSLLDVAYMRAYIASETGVIKNWKWYLDDAISTVYWAIGKEKLTQLYELIQDSTSKTKWNSKQIAYTILKQAVEDGDLWEVEQLAKSMLFQANLSLDVHNRIPSGKWVTELDKEQYYLREFTDKYQFIKSNNSQIALNFVLRKSDRMNTEAKSNLYDENWNINERYYDYIKREMELRDAIRNGDTDMVEAIHNPLVINQKYLWWKLRNDDWTLSEETLNSYSKALNYIAWTEADRWVWETVAMLIASIKPAQEEIIDAAQKWLLSWEWLSRATKEMIDKYFYTEWLLSDYILNLHTWIDSLQWWSGGVASKIKRAIAEFTSLSDSLDKIRDKFESEINISPFDIDHYPLNSVDENIFVAKPTGSYSAPSPTSVSLNILPETKDINRKIKKSKEFKFKE